MTTIDLLAVHLEATAFAAVARAAIWRAINNQRSATMTSSIPPKTPMPQEILDPLLDALADQTGVDPAMIPAERRLVAIAFANNPDRLVTRLAAYFAELAAVHISPESRDAHLGIVSATLAAIGVTRTVGQLRGDVVDDRDFSKVTFPADNVHGLHEPKPKHPHPWTYDEQWNQLMDANGEPVAYDLPEGVGELLEKAVGNYATEHRSRWRIVIGGPKEKGALAGRMAQVWLDGKRLPAITGVTLLSEMDDVVRLGLEVLPSEVVVEMLGDPKVEARCTEHFSKILPGKTCEACDDDAAEKAGKPNRANLAVVEGSRFCDFEDCDQSPIDGSRFCEMHPDERLDGPPPEDAIDPVPGYNDGPGMRPTKG